MKKRLLSIMLTLCMVIGLGISVPMTAGAATSTATSGTCGDNLTWELIDGTFIVSGTGDMYDYENLGTGLSSAPWYKLSSKIKYVYIGDEVTSIGNYAFFSGRAEYSSSLEFVLMGNSVKRIEAYAFNHCHIQKLTLPNSVKYIGRGAFSHCFELDTVAIPNGLTSIERDIHELSHTNPNNT